MALHCPGKSDYSCPHWDHLVRLTVCCDKENPLCGEELGRWITPYRRSVYRTYKTDRRGLTIRQWRRPLKLRSLKIRLPIPFFETISWLSQVAQLLKRREVMLEMKKRVLRPTSGRDGRIYCLVVSVLKKTYNLVISRRSRAGTAKKCANLIVKDCEFFKTASKFLI